MNSAKNGGFTLIEVLVAMVLLAIVFSVVYGAFSTGNRSANMVEEAADLQQTARALLAIIDTELSSIYIRKGQATDLLRGENSEDEGGPMYFDKIEFTTLAHKPMNKDWAHSDICKVSYSAEYDRRNNPIGFFLIEDLTPGLNPDEDELSADRIFQLSNLVIGMDCTYLDEQTQEWVDSWVDRTELPQAVRIELILKASGKDAKPISVASTINLPMRSADENEQPTGRPEGAQ